MTKKKPIVNPVTVAEKKDAIINACLVWRRPKNQAEIRPKIEAYDDSYFLVLYSMYEKTKLTCTDIENHSSSVKWTVGGVEEGSCYDTGNEPEVHIMPEDEPEFDVLDLILEEYRPNISYLAYKKLAKEVITESTSEYRGYYGGHTDYKIKTLDLDKLWDLIKNET